MATAAAANESRQDLLNWINDLLQMNVTKIEQIGTGAVLCQIFDSIFGNVALHKVKFSTHQEFEYIQNFKVLQAAFTLNGVDKYIPVDRLIKLKFQENLEFLQWVKKFWDSNFPGGHYDAIGRRGNKTIEPSSTSASAGGRPQRFGSMAAAAATPAAPRASIRSTEPIRPSSGPARLSTNNSGSNSDGLKAQAMMKEITELRLTVDEVEKERDFYFGKLRDIEIEVQKAMEGKGESVNNDPLLSAISAILYKTEEGFETPDAMTA